MRMFPERLGFFLLYLFDYALIYVSFGTIDNVKGFQAQEVELDLVLAVIPDVQEFHVVHLESAAAHSVRLVLVLLVIEPGGVETLRTAKPVSTRRALYWSMIGGAFLSFSAGGLTSWLVASGVDAGLGEGMSGWLLSIGAAVGVGVYDHHLVKNT